ncbi:MAG: aminomethyl-transferring glycine dehydrogenase [Actinomycetia bacterium]|nr:aminomethyl-transferring glycine dehydrogenase [Actinomycetes bacterium]
MTDTTSSTAHSHDRHQNGVHDLARTDAFIGRHIGPEPGEIAHMLDRLGLTTLEELINIAVPSGIREPEALGLPGPVSEVEVVDRLRDLASLNQPLTSLIGMGYHDTVTPPVVLRNVLENPAWYTAYTPYQPEISQGRLEALLNFQTMVMDLTGFDLANASMLDEGTAAAEGMTMCRRLLKGDGPNGFFVDAACHPQTIEVVRTRAEPLGIDITVGDPTDLDPRTVYGVLLQYPGTDGEIRDHRTTIGAVHEAGGLVVMAADLLALCLLRSPGELGADVAVGTTQRFGVPLGFGGPHAAYFATAERHKRSIPGRLVGVSVDNAGRPALRLALQTREQHIRREKATSNICTAQVLLAVMAGLYACWHGPEGVRTIATRVSRLATILAAGLRAGGVEVPTKAPFDTITARVDDADLVMAAALDQGINLRRVDDHTVGIALDETTTPEIIESVWAAFGVEASVTGLDATTPDLVPEDLRRTDPILTHPVFHQHRSETAMLRYLRMLADKDLALDRTMIPLGSCTMKLNATTEMAAVTWPEFARIHPFAPLDQAGGHLQVISDLEAWLAEITGYAAVSLQPNAGSQGEYAGLLAIRGWHHWRGDHARDVCLIPESAHGTNAASAVMAGMRVVVVACDDQGNIDVADLEAKATEHAETLAALMVTYPSTHGVYEEAIGDICATVHDRGGQVYLDGANLNALVGVARPGRFGSDVSHLNLHKTFCIPHGGGGPGVGPIGVAEHLVPFLPGHGQVGHTIGGLVDGGVNAVAAAPWGSAGILPISWAYVTLMGGTGLTRATQVAILNANYAAHRLNDHFPVLYTGASGLVAHECIIDLRPITRETGVTVDDVAKRLMDYGFHAPTMSFPVAGTLMIEPTESENRAEIDRFCDALIAIKDEIDRVASGQWTAEDSPLRHAPHTAEDTTSDAWARAYSRETAAYPVATLRRAKYWPPVGRIDGATGDKNLMCSCPPLEPGTTT